MPILQYKISSSFHWETVFNMLKPMRCVLNCCNCNYENQLYIEYVYMLQEHYTVMMNYV